MSLETKKCPSCAEQIESGDTVCSFCQAELRDAGPDPSGTCPHCQEKLSSQARFCPQCGLALMSAEKNSCPKCGSRVNPGARFCEFSGLPIISPTPGTTGPSFAPPLSTRISQILRPLGTPAVVAAGLLGAIFLRVGLFAWQKLRPAPLQLLGLQAKLKFHNRMSARPALYRHRKVLLV